MATADAFTKRLQVSLLLLYISQCWPLLLVPTPSHTFESDEEIRISHTSHDRISIITVLRPSISYRVKHSHRSARLASLRGPFTITFTQVSAKEKKNPLICLHEAAHPPSDQAEC